MGKGRGAVGGQGQEEDGSSVTAFGVVVFPIVGVEVKPLVEPASR